MSKEAGHTFLAKLREKLVYAPVVKKQQIG